MKQVLLEAIELWLSPYRTKTGRALFVQFCQDAAVILGFIVFATLLFITTLN